MYNVSERQNTGTLNVFSFLGEKGKPVAGAKVLIKDINGNLLNPLLTDESSQTKNVKLPAPKKSLSLAPVDIILYAKYNVTVEAPGYVTSEINGVQIFADTESTQPVRLLETSQRYNRPTQEITISDHTLIGGNLKLSEDEINQEVPTKISFFITGDTIIPEHVIVHDGHPNNNSA
ncbi:carboxypeptidase-like regulatory domain-containing protein [Bacillus thuringiensis]|uniref:carboxypeptidase-like regulatory domain-containing protein n=1 Tax=Bacillus thuringiensis TaxID=1428 RepID=UPI00211DA3B9|nr:carboxypeptidase-like regulatory domain-containing protein [Bacillus thuringiensis]